jgi:hypothetical protein
MRRAANVPEWEPVNAAAPALPVLSPLVDESVVDAVLKLRREDLVPLGCGDHTKHLLRHSALAWLPAEIAMHPPDLPIRSGGAMAQRDQPGLTTVRAAAF